MTQLCSSSLCNAVPTTVSAVIGNEERGSEGPCGPHAVTAGSRLLEAERSGRNSAFRCVSGLSGPWPSQSVPPMSGDTLIFAHILRGRLVEVVRRKSAVIATHCCRQSMASCSIRFSSCERRRIGKVKIEMKLKCMVASTSDLVFSLAAVPQSLDHPNMYDSRR